MKNHTNLLRLLLFIQSQPWHVPVWLNANRLVAKGSETAVYFRLVGKNCQITVPVELWTNVYVMQRWVEPSLNQEKKFLLTPAGHKALEQLRVPQELGLVKGKRPARKKKKAEETCTSEEQECGG